MTEADVLVIGGGTAGTIAAIQAARAGATTLLVERGPHLGGTLTAGNANPERRFSRIPHHADARPCCRNGAVANRTCRK